MRFNALCVSADGFNHRLLSRRHAEEEFIAFCKENLAPYKVPKFVEFRDELPKTTVGKILRRVLVEEDLKKQAG